VRWARRRWTAPPAGAGPRPRPPRRRSRTAPGRRPARPTRGPPPRGRPRRSPRPARPRPPAPRRPLGALRPLRRRGGATRSHAARGGRPVSIRGATWAPSLARPCARGRRARPAARLTPDPRAPLRHGARLTRTAPHFDARGRVRRARRVLEGPPVRLSLVRQRLCCCGDVLGSLNDRDAWTRAASVAGIGGGFERIWMGPRAHGRTRLCGESAPAGIERRARRGLLNSAGTRRSPMGATTPLRAARRRRLTSSRSSVLVGSPRKGGRRALPRSLSPLAGASCATTHAPAPKPIRGRVRTDPPSNFP